MELAPIVVFSYNRPDHLRRTLDALSKNELADQSVLYIYCDGAKPDASDEQKARIAENREVARNVKGFGALRVVEREKNIGLKNNIVGAVTEIVNQYGRIITLEDDIVSSPGFLRYMNDALEVYKDESKVMHVSAYMYPHKGRLPETFFYPVPYPGGGWATWKRAWRFYNDNTQELYDYWKDKWEVFDTNGGTIYRKQLEDNLRGRISTWFVKWHAVMLQQGGMTLYPGKSLTTNIGFDSSASNCLPTNKYYVYDLAESIEVKKKPVKMNRRCKREIYAFYQGRWYNKRRREKLIRQVLSVIMFWRKGK